MLNGTLSATDVDGDALSFAITKGPRRGIAVITNGATGAFTYTPNADFAGTDSFTFQATDPAGASGRATITITV